MIAYMKLMLRTMGREQGRLSKAPSFSLSITVEEREPGIDVTP